MPNPTQYRSFWRWSSQPITWQFVTDKQTIRKKLNTNHKNTHINTIRIKENKQLNIQLAASLSMGKLQGNWCNGFWTLKQVSDITHSVVKITFSFDTRLLSIFFSRPASSFSWKPAQHNHTVYFSTVSKYCTKLKMYWFKCCFQSAMRQPV